jgi:hypothetical protein
MNSAIALAGTRIAFDTRTCRSSPRSQSWYTVDRQTPSRLATSGNDCCAGASPRCPGRYSGDLRRALAALLGPPTPRAPPISGRGIIAERGDASVLGLLASSA